MYEKKKKKKKNLPFNNDGKQKLALARTFLLFATVQVIVTTVCECELCDTWDFDFKFSVKCELPMSNAECCGLTECCGLIP